MEAEGLTKVVNSRFLMGLKRKSRGGRYDRIFFNPKAKYKLTYAWGFGVVTNNQDESLALYQELHILNLMAILKVMVIRDSLIILKKM